MESDDGEILLVGYDECYKHYTAIGIIINDGDCYNIKQQSPLKYKKIINKKNNKKITVKSDITSGFWTDVIFTKKEGLSAKYKYLLGDDIFEMITKLPNDSWLRPIKTTSSIVNYSMEKGKKW